MPNIYYKSSGYTKDYSHINSNNLSCLWCRKLDLYRAMITVGNPTFISARQIKAYGMARVVYSSVIEKIGIVFENIQSDKTGMRLNPIFNNHISDKKRIVSYNLGMAFAKIYAEKLLLIPSLIHVESLKNMGGIEFNHVTNGQAREPDLVGQCINGKWHVFEAKGMSVNKLKAEIKSAKNQASRIATINGITPETMNGCATYFNSKRILTYLEDPESNNEIKCKISNEKYFDSIYKPLFLLEKALGAKFKLNREGKFSYYSIDVRAKGVNLKIGLVEEVYDLLNQREFGELFSINKSKFINPSVSRDPTYSLGLDGVVVKYRDY